MSKKYASCDFKEECFARTTIGVCGFDIPKCTILTSTVFNTTTCPFAKPDRSVTNGKAYPYDLEKYAEMLDDKIE